jgi:predicted phosphodiesterase
MKLRVFSDLHLEFRPWTPPDVAACDLVILAGDIAVGTSGIRWARSAFGPDLPIVYVAGNHEYYGHSWPQLRRELREVALGEGVHWLEGDEVIVGHARILGATLWTDFELDGSEVAAVSRAMTLARRAMPDYQIVRMSPGVPLSPQDTRELHRLQREWLRTRLAVAHTPGPTIVVTHHLPRRESVHPRFATSVLNPAFASELSQLCRGPDVALWVHGHTHESFDYVADGCRVVCNPRGYLPDEPNPGFDPRGVVEIA